MKFIRISKTRVVNSDHILSISGFRTWTNANYIEICHNCPMPQGSFVAFSSPLNVDFIYETEDPDLFKYFLTLISNTNNE